MSYSKRQGGSYEGRRGHGKGFKRCPVELGKELEVEIAELSPKGEGIARSQGFVIYVSDAKPGDRVEIKNYQNNRKSSKWASSQIDTRAELPEGKSHYPKLLFPLRLTTNLILSDLFPQLVSCLSEL